VGAGPAALFAACELLRHGVRPRIVERRLAPHQEARGTAFQHALDRHLATYLVPEINPATAA